MQINHKNYGLGGYAVEADAAAARDAVAKVLGYPLNFKTPRKITGQNSKGADQALTNAVEVAEALVLGNPMTVVFFGRQASKILTNMPRQPQAEGTGDGACETEGIDDNTRAKARAPSKGKKDAADPQVSKKRAAPTSANTSNAAKKSKTSAPACQVRCDRNSAHGLPTHREQFKKSGVMTNDSNRRHRQGERLRSIRGFTKIKKSGSQEPG